MRQHVHMLCRITRIERKYTRVSSGVKLNPRVLPDLSRSVSRFSIRKQPAPRLRWTIGLDRFILFEYGARPRFVIRRDAEGGPELTNSRLVHYLRFLTLSAIRAIVAFHAGSQNHLRHGHVFDNNKHNNIHAKSRRAVSITNQQS